MRPLALLIHFHLLLASDGLGDAPLSSVTEIRNLSVHEAEKALPVRLSGVVVYHDPASWLTFVHDGEASIYVSAFSRSLRIGDEVELEGVTAPGRLGRFVTSAKGAEDGTVFTRVIGERALPAPVSVQLHLLNGPSHEAQWIALSGVITEVELVGGHAKLGFECADRSIAIRIPGFVHSSALPRYLKGLEIHASGIWAQHKESARDFSLLVPSLAQIVPSVELLNQLFESPAQGHSKFLDLRIQDTDRRQLFLGQVLLHRPGRGFFLSVPEKGWRSKFWVDTTQGGVLTPGQWVRASGYTDVVATQPVLRDAIFRGSDIGELPEPEIISGHQINDARYHGSLVTLKGVLRHTERTRREDTLLFETETGFLEARHVLTDGMRLPAWDSGSQLKLRGVLLNVATPAIGYDGLAEPPQLWLRSTQDGVLLAIPSWWTKRRISLLLIIVAVVALLAASWAFTLRRRVRSQTTFIQQQLASATRLAERSRISQDWHDSVEQHLTGISLQMEAASTQLPLNPSRAQHFLGLACAMTLHTREEARRAIWDLQPSPVEEGGLVCGLEWLAQTLQSEEGPRFELTIDSMAGRLPLRTEAALFRIAQEAVANALKHSRSRTISLTMKRSVGALDLIIRDDGCGFDNQRITSLGDATHFGLRGMEERANRLGATFCINSVLGRGSAVEVKLPLEFPVMPSIPPHVSAPHPHPSH